jgi:hypothetical protein
MAEWFGATSLFESPDRMGPDPLTRVEVTAGMCACPGGRTLGYRLRTVAEELAAGWDWG